MGAVSELRKRSNKFVADLQAHIEAAVDDNQQLLNLNKSQLKDEHATINDSPILPPYSNEYAALKGFRTPDLYFSGDLFKSMTIEAKGTQYIIEGHTDYTEKLKAKYKGIFGVAKSKQSIAKQITTKLLAQFYKAEVIK